MLAHSQGTFCRVVHFRISTTAPAVTLSRVPQKTTKNTTPIAWYHMLEKTTQNIPRLVLLPARQLNKLLLGYRTGKIKSNPLEPHFETSATMSQSLDGTKTAVAVPHCSENTNESIAGWCCIFGTEMWLELYLNDGMSYKEKYTGRGASSRRFVQKIGELAFFLWAVQHRFVFFQPLPS